MILKIKTLESLFWVLIAYVNLKRIFFYLMNIILFEKLLSLRFLFIFNFWKYFKFYYC